MTNGTLPPDIETAIRSGAFGAEDKARGQRELTDIFIADFENQTYINRLSQAIGVGVSPHAVARRQPVDKITETTKETTKETGAVKGIITGAAIATLGPLLTAAGLWAGGVFDKPTPETPKPPVTEPGKTTVIDNSTKEGWKLGDPEVVPPKE